MTTHTPSAEHELTGLRENFKPAARWRKAINTARAINRLNSGRKPTETEVPTTAAAAAGDEIDGEEEELVMDSSGSGSPPSASASANPSRSASISRRINKGEFAGDDDAGNGGGLKDKGQSPVIKGKEESEGKVFEAPEKEVSTGRVEEPSLLLLQLDSEGTIKAKPKQQYQAPPRIEISQANSNPASPSSPSNRHSPPEHKAEFTQGQNAAGDIDKDTRVHSPSGSANQTTENVQSHSNAKDSYHVHMHSHTDRDDESEEMYIPGSFGIHNGHRNGHYQHHHGGGWTALLRKLSLRS